MFQLLIPSLTFAAIVSFLAGIKVRAQPARVDVRKRLGQVFTAEENQDIRQKELGKPLSERILRPFLLRLSGLAEKILPTGMLKSLEPRVKRAGYPKGLSAAEFLGIKILLALGLAALLYHTGGQAEGRSVVIMLILGAALGWKLPDFYLAKKAADKIRLFEKTFPDTLDLLTVSVEAGLGFDGAIAKVVEKSNGPIASEFRRVLQEIKMGKARKEALRDFADRCGADDVKTFVNAIIQTDQLGLSIANTLRVQAEQMRRKRKQRVEEQAMKAPVKMLIPLILFIFPTIFIILLGPALIQILEGFAL